MEITKFDKLTDLALIKVFSYLSCSQLLDSFWNVNLHLDNILEQSGVIRHVNWIKLCNEHRNVISHRLLSINSLITDCLTIAEPLLEKRNLRRLWLIDIHPASLMDYVWTDWRYALDGLCELRFIVVNSSQIKSSEMERTNILLSYLIGYVPSLHTVYLSSVYKIKNFSCPPITIGSLKYLNLTVKYLSVLLNILRCLSSCLHRVSIGMEFEESLFENSSSTFVSCLIKTQQTYVDCPLQTLKEVTLHSIPSEINNETILPWITKFIERDYMPTLQTFNFIINKNIQSSINEQEFTRPDLRINIL